MLKTLGVILKLLLKQQKTKLFLDNPSSSFVKILFEIFKTKELQSKDCLRIFQMNSWYGFFITIGLFFNYI